MEPSPEESTQQTGYTLPGYKYLGPGNELDLGEPTNELDRIAKEHDESYNEIQEEYEEGIAAGKDEKNISKIAKTRIKEADETFLKKVYEYTPTSKYDGAARIAALTGIGTKYLGERVLGTIYPRFRAHSKKDSFMDGGLTMATMPNVIANGVDKEMNKKTFKFKKMFNFHIKSTLCTYLKEIPSANATNGKIAIKTFIHTLPWDKIFMYLTHKEYDDIVEGNHTATVKKTYIKIYNLGNRTPFVASSGNVQYANANSQTTIGIWEDMGKHGMIKLGNNITPEILYGKTLKTLTVQGQHRQVAGDIQSGACQGRFIDNRMEYWYHNGIYEDGNIKTNSIEQYSYLPALIASASKFLNATNSIGLIYENEHKPTDGVFHIKNNAWRFLNYDYLKSKAPIHNIILRDGMQTSVNHMAAGPIKYEFATVDNYLYSNILNVPALEFTRPIGIGIIPLLSSDGAHENSILNIMVETGIEVEAMSHGQNILYTAMRNPQPNPLVMGYRMSDHKQSGIILGHQPITDLISTPIEHQPEPVSENTEIASRQRRGLEGESYDHSNLENNQKFIENEIRSLQAEQNYEKTKIEEINKNQQNEKSTLADLKRKAETALNSIKSIEEKITKLNKQTPQAQTTPKTPSTSAPTTPIASPEPDIQPRTPTAPPPRPPRPPPQRPPKPSNVRH